MSNKSKKYLNADLTFEELEELAEEIRHVLLPNKAVTFYEYIKIVRDISPNRIGYRKFNAIKYEAKLAAYLPEKILDILKNKSCKNLQFNESDDKFLIHNRAKGVEWLARHFIPTTAWQNNDKSIHGCAVQQFLEFKHHASDKYWVHGYTPYYDFHMHDFQNRHINILELGVMHGYSLDLWHRAFPNAKIYGIDISTKRMIPELVNKNRIKFLKGDESGCS